MLGFSSSYSSFCFFFSFLPSSSLLPPLFVFFLLSVFLFLTAFFSRYPQASLQYMVRSGRRERFQVLYSMHGLLMRTNLAPYLERCEGEEEKEGEMSERG